MSTVALSGVPAANSGVFTRMMSAYKRRVAVRATIKELNALSDRELFDIGLSRGEIYSVANEAYLDS